MAEGAMAVGGRLVLKCNIYKQFLAADMHYIAKGAVPPPSKIEVHPAIANAEIADLEIVEPLGELRVKNIEFLAGSAGTEAKNRSQHQEPAPGCPCLRRTRDRVLHGFILLVPLHSTKKFWQPIIAK